MSLPTLRVIGTSATLTEELCQKAKSALAFPIHFEVLDGESCMRKGVLRPESYDIYDQWFYSLDVLWTAGSIQAIDTSRICRWPQVEIAGNVPGEIFAKTSSVKPYKTVFVQMDGTLGSTYEKSTDPKIAMLPTVYNVDSFAYKPELRSKIDHNEPESWAWLLDDRLHGRCSVGLDPAASAVELALAANSAGFVKIEDPGNLTIEEIDELFDLLNSLKRRGHFTRFWSTNEESVSVLKSSNCELGSLWSPAYYTLRAGNKNVVYASPAEGYRGWHSGQCLSANTSGEVLEMAYQYMNWWLDGTPGAILARQGYYISVIDSLRETLSKAEWDYWYEGKPATESLNNSSSMPAVKLGDCREGGSYKNRVANVVVWSTIMPEHNYLARRWREFLEF